jgi:hypothetical protein
MYRALSKRLSSEIGGNDDDMEAQKMFAETLLDNDEKQQVDGNY